LSAGESHPHAKCNCNCNGNGNRHAIGDAFGDAFGYTNSDCKAASDASAAPNTASASLTSR
jgi:hypothetical protein